MSNRTEKYEVIVAGGGLAGVTAAIAAARNNAKTLLVEKYGYLGGDGTAGFVNLGNTFHNMLGEQIVKGIPQEIIDRTKEFGDLGHIASPIRPPKMKATPWNEEILKYVCQEMVLEAGAKLLLHTFVSGTSLKGKDVVGIEIVNKSGRQSLSAKVVVDATGDGDVAAAAGAPTMKGRKEDGLLIPPTTMFKMTHVNFEKTLEYIRQNPEKFRPLAGWSVGTDPALPVIHVNLASFAEEYQEGKKKGYISPMIDPQHSSILRMSSPRHDEVYVNMTRILNVDPTDAWSLTYGEVEGMRQAVGCARWLKEYIPGFESASFVIAPMLGIREGRRIVGEYILTEEDIVEGRKFQDVIAKTGLGLDIHAVAAEGGHKFVPTKGGGSCDIPYRCLVPKEIDNLLATGRCISADDGAFHSIRGIPSCMAFGQAAGTAAALSAKEGTKPRNLDISGLQKTLTEQGAILRGTH